MKPADKVVEALLGDQEDPKDFFNRHEDLTVEIVRDRLRKLKIKLKEVDGVEVYGIYTDPHTGDQFSRHNHDDPPATLWGVSLHSINTDRWLEDWQNYESPQAALDGAEELYTILQSLAPNQEIDFVDDTNPD